MRVIDIRSGTGDLALSLGRLVGAAGSALGLEIDAESVSVANRRASEAGLPHVELRVADAMSTELPPVDAVVGRLVLMHLPDPVSLLRRVARALTAGGVVVRLVRPARPAERVGTTRAVTSDGALSDAVDDARRGRRRDERRRPAGSGCRRLA